MTEKEALAEARAYYEMRKAQKHEEAFRQTIASQRHFYETTPAARESIKTKQGYDPVDDPVRAAGSLIPPVNEWRGVESFEKFIIRAIAEGKKWHCAPTTESFEFAEERVKCNKLNTELTNENPRPGVYRISRAAADLIRAGQEKFVTVDYHGELVAVTYEQAYARNLREKEGEWAGIGRLQLARETAREALEQQRNIYLESKARAAAGGNSNARQAAVNRKPSEQQQQQDGGLER